MSEALILIEKSAKQNIWQIKGDYPIYATRKNVYVYDFAVIAIRKKDGSIQKYCNNIEGSSIFIACERSHGIHRMLIQDISCKEHMDIGCIDYIFMYFEKSSQAQLAFTTAETFVNTGFFMNTVSSIDIPSLREEAMSIAYMLDSTKSIFRIFSNYNSTERRSVLNEFSE